MSTLSNNDIARTIYLMSKDKSTSEQNEVVGKVVNFLSKKRLLSKSPDILSRLSKIIDKEEGRVMAKVSSVEKLSRETKKDIESAVKKRYKAKEVLLAEVIDSKLIGGFKIEVSDEVIDLSVKNRIEKLQEHLTKSV